MKRLIYINFFAIIFVWKLFRIFCNNRQFLFLREALSSKNAKNLVLAHFFFLTKTFSYWKIVYLQQKT